MERTK